MKSVAFAIFITLISLLVRYFLHRSYTGIFNFVGFIAFLIAIGVSIYGKEWTSSTHPSASQLGSQIRSVLEDDWEPAQQWSEVTAVMEA